MLRPVWFMFSLAALLFLASCASDNVSDRSSQIQSCYHTGFDIKCVSTPGAIGKSAIDVDGDNQIDPLVCGDGVSESDSDGDADSDADSEADLTAASDGEVTSDDLDADSDSDSDSDSTSDSDCGPSNEDDASASDSDSDADGDGDADLLSDAVDCDCLAAIPPTDGTKPPPVIVK